MYANQNGGRFPERFEDLLLTQDLTSEVFICPSSQGERAQGETPEEVADEIKFCTAEEGCEKPVVVDIGCVLSEPTHEAP